MPSSKQHTPPVYNILLFDEKFYYNFIYLGTGSYKYLHISKKYYIYFHYCVMIVAKQ